MSNEGVRQQSRRITYEGPAARVSQLAQMLREEGIAVTWERPHEERGASEVLDTVVSELIAAGSLAATRAAVSRFRSLIRGRAKVKIEGDPDDGGFFDG